MIHAGDSICAGSLDESIKDLGPTVLQSPLHRPKANAIGERVIESIRHVGLDELIPGSGALASDAESAGDA